MELSQKSNISSKGLKILVIALFGLMIFLSFNKHSKSGFFNYHSEIWADKAGYYMYLPATFNYGFKASNFPESIDKKTGNGFTLNYEEDKVFSKYTCGVALLQTPFYLGAHLLASQLGYEANGFSPIYHWSVNISSVFFALIGFIFLFKFLRHYYKDRDILISLFSLGLGTNLYYYAIDETGMSHVYSFSLFSVFLYLIKTLNFLKKGMSYRVFLLGLVIGLIFLIRPTDIIFVILTFLLLDIEKLSNIKKRVIISKKILFLGFISVIIPLIPQFLYWKYYFDSWIHYSYANEQILWLRPLLLKTWFEPNNGLFLYSPYYIVPIIGSIAMIINKKNNGWLIIITFLITSYICSCWWAWAFGCSYGARSFVEFVALFSISSTYLVSKILKSNNVIKFISLNILVLLVLFNLKMCYTFDDCFFGIEDWDWTEYLKLVCSKPK